MQSINQSTTSLCYTFVYFKGSLPGVIEPPREARDINLEALAHDLIGSYSLKST